MAADKVTFLTSWYAQAEHGGLYQTLAKGLYQKHGLDVTIRMDGPQVNGMQLLTSGQADFLMGYDLQVLKSVEQGLPVTIVAASFQTDLQGMLTHDDVNGLADLKNNKTVLVPTSGRTTWWPWLKSRYSLTDAQSRPYTFNLQPFVADANTAQQAYPSSEPFQAMKAGVKSKFFPLASTSRSTCRARWWCGQHRITPPSHVHDGVGCHTPKGHCTRPSVMVKLEPCLPFYLLMVQCPFGYCTLRILVGLFQRQFDLTD